MSGLPILVVGAGPVGLTLAGELRRGEVPVRIVDRLPEPSRLSKAVAVHARTLELLAADGLADRFLAAFPNIEPPAASRLPVASARASRRNETSVPLRPRQEPVRP